MPPPTTETELNLREFGLIPLSFFTPPNYNLPVRQSARSFLFRFLVA